MQFLWSFSNSFFNATCCDYVLILVKTFEHLEQAVFVILSVY